MTLNCVWGGRDRQTYRIERHRVTERGQRDTERRQGDSRLALF